ncbi:MAG: DUF5700 domain-containing putative Zn-dependent protease [Sphaerochaetaceae bacterium]
MNKVILLGLLIICVNRNISFGQAVDLSSVDEFFKVTSIIKEGQKISDEQWADFDNSTGYKIYADSENKFIINTIKATINMAFGNSELAKKDSVLSISSEEMAENRKLMFQKRILTNYLDMKENFNSIESFRENYDFSNLIESSKLRLFAFLEKPIDTSFRFKTVYFNCMDADGYNAEDAIYLDFNLINKMTEEQRINFLAHEFFHNYREKFENHDFNHQCDLNYGIDMIQNEGIADMIDKTDGYKNYYTMVIQEPELAEIMVSLYKQAPEDLGKVQDMILKYSIAEISEKELVDEWIEIVKYNGHAIGFFMANQIEKAGYNYEMRETFYNPYAFFALYNRAAKKQKIFHLSDEFMAYLRSMTEEFYR